MDLSKLSTALKNEIFYPAEMAFVETGIQGRGFYPGCLGFSPPKSPIGGLMLLGRDFGTRAYYEGLAGLPPRDEHALTWRHTRDIYIPSASQPSLGDLPVWCTNYLMGVRRNGSAKGNMKHLIKAADWVTYESSCWNFFLKQFLLQKPLVIVIFGGFNREDLTQENRMGAEPALNRQHIFSCGGHSAPVVMADHPHSLIRSDAKDAARSEVKRIREIYLAEARKAAAINQ